MQAGSTADIWSLFKLITDNWQALAAIGTVVAFIVALAIRFSRVEDHVKLEDSQERKGPLSLLTRRRAAPNPNVRVSESPEVNESTYALKIYLGNHFSKLYTRMDHSDDKLEEFKHQHDRDFSELVKKTDRLEQMAVEASNYREEGVERTRLLLRGVTASLEGLLEQGCNGPVKKALGELEEYRDIRASK